MPTSGCVFAGLWGKNLDGMWRWSGPRHAKMSSLSSSLTRSLRVAMSQLILGLAAGLIRI
eukprot:8839177-Pyramimonas_sp.AAC.1